MKKIIIVSIILAFVFQASLQSKEIEIAIYEGEGTSMCHLATKYSLEDLGYGSEYINKEENLAGTLENYDILIIPGGNAYEQFLGLGDDGISQIRDWVAAGGDYIGVCAGAYLAWETAILPKNYPNPEDELSLGIGDINIINIVNITDEMEEWDDISYIETSAGPKAVVFPTKWFTEYEIDLEGKRMNVLYAGGPLFEQENEVIANYTGKVENSFSQPIEFRENMLKDSGAIVTNEYKEGNVFLFSFHPELKIETYWMLEFAINLVSDKQPIFVNYSRY